MYWNDAQKKKGTCMSNYWFLLNFAISIKCFKNFQLIFLHFEKKNYRRKDSRVGNGPGRVSVLDGRLSLARENQPLKKDAGGPVPSLSLLKWFTGKKGFKDLSKSKI